MSTTREGDVQELMESQLSLQPHPFSPLMSQKERGYFDSYAQGKSQADWFEYEVIVVGHLAKISVMIDDLLVSVETNGTTTLNAKGSISSHPDVGTLQSLMRLEISSIKSMRLAVKEGQVKRSKRSDTTKRKGRETTVIFDKGNLLAKPD